MYVCIHDTTKIEKHHTHCSDIITKSLSIHFNRTYINVARLTALYTLTKITIIHLATKSYEIKI